MLLADISPEDCAREGFPELTPHQFVMMLSHHYKNPALSYSRCNRIAFRYVNYPGQWVKGTDAKLYEMVRT